MSTVIHSAVCSQDVHTDYLAWTSPRFIFGVSHVILAGMPTVPVGSVKLDAKERISLQRKIYWPEVTCLPELTNQAFPPKSRCRQDSLISGSQVNWRDTHLRVSCSLELDRHCGTSWCM